MKFATYLLVFFAFVHQYIFGQSYFQLADSTFGEPFICMEVGGRLPCFLNKDCETGRYNSVFYPLEPELGETTRDYDQPGWFWPWGFTSNDGEIYELGLQQDDIYLAHVLNDSITEIVARAPGMDSGFYLSGIGGFAWYSDTLVVQARVKDSSAHTHFGFYWHKVGLDSIGRTVYVDTTVEVEAKAIDWSNETQKYIAWFQASTDTGRAYGYFEVGNGFTIEDTHFIANPFPLESMDTTENIPWVNVTNTAVHNGAIHQLVPKSTWYLQEGKIVTNYVLLSTDLDSFYLKKVVKFTDNLTKAHAGLFGLTEWDGGVYVAGNLNADEISNYDTTKTVIRVTKLNDGAVTLWQKDHVPDGEKHYNLFGIEEFNNDSLIVIYGSVFDENFPQNNMDPFFLILDGNGNIIDTTDTNNPVSGVNAEHEWSKVHVYPNPVMDELVLLGAGGITKGEMHIYDVKGQPVLTTMLQNKRINVGILEPGNYFFTIEHEGKLYQGRFVKF